MELMGGATPKGLEEAGVGETPRLEMVLPGVTAMPGAGDEPEGHSGRNKTQHDNIYLISGHTLCSTHFQIIYFVFFINIRFSDMEITTQIK